MGIDNLNIEEKVDSAAKVAALEGIPSNTYIKNSEFNAVVDKTKEVVEGHNDLRETVENISNSGVSYATLAIAMAVNPLPADNTLFNINNPDDTTDDGVYKYDSTQGSGYLRLRDLPLVKATGEFDSSNDKDGLTPKGFSDRLIDLGTNFPYSSSFKINSNRRLFLLDIEVYGYEGTEPLFVYNVWRSYDPGSGNTWKVLLRSFNESTGESTNICQFTLSAYVEPELTEGRRIAKIESNQDLSGNGVSFTAMVDWEAALAGQDIKTYNESSLDTITWKSHLKNNLKDTVYGILDRLSYKRIGVITPISTPGTYTYDVMFEVLHEGIYTNFPDVDNSPIQFKNGELGYITKKVNQTYYEKTVNNYNAIFPFAAFPINKNRKNFLLDIEVYGYKGTEPLFVYNVWRSYDPGSGDTWKVLLRSFNESTGESTNICQFTLSAYVEPELTEGRRIAKIESNQDLSGNGVSFTAMVDWEAALAGQDIKTYNESSLDTITWKPKVKDQRLDDLEEHQTTQDQRLDDLEEHQTTQDQRLDDLEEHQTTQDQRLDDIGEDLYKNRNVYLESDLLLNYYYPLNGSSVPESPTEYTTTTNNWWSCIKIAVYTGDEITIATRSTGAVALAYALTDVERNIYSVADSSVNSLEAPITIKAKKNGYIYVNMLQPTNSNFSVKIDRYTIDYEEINRGNRLKSLEFFKQKNYDWQSFDADYIFYLGYGQSLSVGGGSNALSTISFKDNKRLGSNISFPYSNELTTFQPLVNGSTEHIIVPAINFLRYYANSIGMGFNTTFVATSCGQGGTSIEWLSKDCPANNGDYFQRIIDAFNAAKSIADSEGKTIKFGGTIFLQGEANSTARSMADWDGTGPAISTKEGYKGYLEQLIADIEEAALSVFTDQTESPAFFIYQTQMNYTATDMPIGSAQLEVANENDNVYMFSPCYAYKTGEDPLHPTGNGYRWLAEKAAIAMRNVLIEKKQYSTLQPHKIERISNNELRIHFISEQFPLNINNYTIDTILENYGFQAYNNLGEEIEISEVKVYDTFVCVFLLEGQIDPISIAYANSSNVSGKGNITDSFSEKSREVFTDQSGQNYNDVFIPNTDETNSILGKKYMLDNWLVAFRYELNEDSLVLI
ncbi:hypothetical protein NBRC110019_07310 [Neptunitalea chrysea]|uniref:Sialate O-acetylesterase domain-containing protein n=1 Tax=Neptunitalea chrysea TaxID=1647581 RepID=A0A9W6B4I4_9FLAO|nr:hypothetical protein [Neptunitalea chrysea]GLB51692.1 hypothetical protein NBRC110019_07310 [Neptunitalea chrysea]